MEPTKTPSTPIPDTKPPLPLSPSPPSASSVPGGSAAATATANSQHEGGHTNGKKTVHEFFRPATPVLRFTPYAWAKLLFFRDADDTEIGGFGITSLTEDDLLLVEDFVTVKQAVSSVTVEFDDAAVADLYDDQVAQGRKPQQFSRIWIHTHPGNSASPSGTDESTFARVFGTCDWAVMFILAKGGQTYSRLRFNVGPGGEQQLKTEVEFDCLFEGSDFASWDQEYTGNVFCYPAGPWGPVKSQHPSCDAFDLTPGERKRLEEITAAQAGVDISNQSEVEAFREEFAEYLAAAEDPIYEGRFA